MYNKSMLCVVSTIKDTLANVKWFVESNTKNGADHLFVFLDDTNEVSDSEVVGYLEDHRNVTVISSATAWWGTHRPAKLNIRQCINANVIKFLLGRHSSAEWLFHIDGDETLHVDRGVLDGLHTGIESVQLAPWEVASSGGGQGRPTWFKRPLTDDDLVLLATLGVIEDSTNRSYFHGHLQGKAGVRPSARNWLTLHRAVDFTRHAVTPFKSSQLRHLHYESYSSDEFIRKWTALVSSGPTASFRPGRARTARALWTLVGKELPRETLERYLLKIYQQTTEDDLVTLRDLGLLVEVDPRQGPHDARPLPSIELNVIEGELLKLMGEPKKNLFYHGTRPLPNGG